MKKALLGTFLCIFAGCCWGVSGILGKYLFEYKGIIATQMVSVRLLFSGPLMLLIARLRSDGRSLTRIWDDDVSSNSLILYATIGIGLNQLTYFLAIQYTDPGTVTVIEYTFPLMVLIYSIIKWKKKPSTQEVVAALSVVFGTFVLVTHCNIHTLQISPRILLLCFGAAGCYAFNNIQPIKIIKEYGTFTVLGWGMFFAGMMAFFCSEMWNPVGTWDFTAILVMVGIILIGSVIPYGANMYGITLIGSVQGSIFCSVEPLVSTLLSVLLFQAAFGAYDLAAMAWIMAGVIMLTMKG